MSKMLTIVSFLADPVCPYTDDAGSGSAILGILSIARKVVQTLQIVVPIALIIWGTIDIGKAVIAGDEKKMKEAQKPFIKRIISAVIVFLIPFLVTLILGYVSNGEWKACWDAAKNSTFKTDSIKSSNDFSTTNSKKK